MLWLCEKKIILFLTKDPRRKALGVSIIDPWRTVCCWLGRGPFSLTILLYKYIGWGQLKSFDLSNSSTERYIPKKLFSKWTNYWWVDERFSYLLIITGNLYVLQFVRLFTVMGVDIKSESDWETIKTQSFWYD